MELSIVEKTILAEFQIQRDHWKGVVFDFVRSNPAATSTEGIAYINTQAIPSPRDLGLDKDDWMVPPISGNYLVNMLTFYIQENGGWNAVKAIILDHPKTFVLAIAPELGRPLLTKINMLAGVILGNPDMDVYGVEAINRSTADTYHTDGLGKGLLATKTITGTVDGTVYTLRQSYTYSIVSNRLTRIASAWEII